MNKSLQPLRSEALESCAGLRHGFFSRSMEGHGRDIAAFFSIPEKNLLAPKQIHSARALVVRAPWDADGVAEADGLATDCPGLALSISTADCVPVLLADGEANVIGALHAGWRGALGGICEATLAAMEKLGARASRVCAVLGPSISKPCYEVDAPFRESFAQAGEASRAEAFFSPAEREGRWLFDLPGYVAMRLQSVGIGRVEDVARCTYLDESLYFSYRRATHQGTQERGRQRSVIMLEKK